MKSLMMVGAATLALFAGSGCVGKYTHGVSSSLAVTGTEVETEASGTGILHLTAPDLNASDELKGKCPSGKISNVETQGEVRDVIGIVQLYDVKVHAICNP